MFDVYTTVNFHETVNGERAAPKTLSGDSRGDPEADGSCPPQLRPSHRRRRQQRGLVQVVSSSLEAPCAPLRPRAGGVLNPVLVGLARHACCPPTCGVAPFSLLDPSPSPRSRSVRGARRVLSITSSAGRFEHTVLPGWRLVLVPRGT